MRILTLIVGTPECYSHSAAASRSCVVAGKSGGSCELG